MDKPLSESQPFLPFVNDTQVWQVDEIMLENDFNELRLSGLLTIRRDADSLHAVIQLRNQLTAIALAIEENAVEQGAAGKEIETGSAHSEEVAVTPPRTTRNPFL